MKTPKEWQDELAGETSLQSIAQIQSDALYHVAKIIYQRLCFKEDGKAYFGNIAELELHTEIMNLALDVSMGETINQDVAATEVKAAYGKEP